jgi:hypothetical protein
MPPTRTLAFTASHGMINRVHGHTANVRPFALPTAPAGFSQLLAFMLCIADLPNTGPAFLMETPHFTGGQFYQNIVAFLGHQLGRSTGASYKLGALAYFHLNIMNDGTQWDVPHGQTISSLDIHFVTRLNGVTHFYAGRGEYISFLTIGVKEQGNIGRTVWIVFNSCNLSRDINLVALEVDHPVFPLMASTDMAGSHSTIIVSAT